MIVNKGGGGGGGGRGSRVARIQRSTFVLLLLLVVETNSFSGWINKPRHAGKKYRICSKAFHHHCNNNNNNNNINFANFMISNDKNVEPDDMEIDSHTRNGFHNGKTNGFSKVTTTTTPVILQRPDTTRNTFGDIMYESGNNHNQPITTTTTTTTTSSAWSGLVTTNDDTLDGHYFRNTTAKKFSPLEKIALTANGNLQRIFASYYDAPVHVKLIYQREYSPNVWHRRVTLSTHGRVFCTATSVVHVHDETCQEWVHSGKIGLGQLFRQLNRLPTFTLLQAGRLLEEENNNGGGMWRDYELKSQELSCRIHEEFSTDAWNLDPCMGPRHNDNNNNNKDS